LQSHREIVTQIMAERACGEAAKIAGLKELSAIRSYRRTWRVQAGLKGIERPHKKLHKTYAAFCPERIARLKAEAAGKSPPPPPQATQPGDVVLEAESARIGGNARPVTDEYAHGGQALELRGKRQPKRPSKNPEDTADF